jgi:hypothetical protein
VRPVSVIAPTRSSAALARLPPRSMISTSMRTGFTDSSRFDTFSASTSAHFSITVPSPCWMRMPSSTLSDPRNPP